MADTRRIALYIDADAIELLGRLAPPPNKRGQYVSDLIRRAAREAGEMPAEPDLEQEVARLAAQLEAVKRRIRRQKAASEGQGVTP